MEPEPPVTLLTSGILHSSVSWGLDENGKPMAPPSKVHGKTTGPRLAVARIYQQILIFSFIVKVEILLA